MIMQRNVSSWPCLVGSLFIKHSTSAGVTPTLQILLMDKAATSVDLDTNLLQRVVRTEFACCVVLAIAHRLNTIMDAAQVLVMAHDLLQVRAFEPARPLVSALGRSWRRCGQLALPLQGWWHAELEGSGGSGKLKLRSQGAARI